MPRVPQSKNAQLKMSRIRLSRLTITGTITDSTPNCVIDEILSAHNLSCVDKISNSYIEIDQASLADKKLTRSLTRSLIPSLRALARYINDQCEWNRSQIKDAVNFLNQHENIPLDPCFEVGRQTPDNPNKINACLLYFYCRKYKLTVSKHDTLAEMSTKLRHFIIINTKQFTIVEHRRNYNLTILDALGESIKRTTAPEVVDDPHIAIAVGALVHGVDLTYAINPIEELNNIILGNSVSKTTIENAKNDSGRTCIAIDNCFNPKLPKSLYNDITLRELALKEGYTTQEISSDPYSLLQTAALSLTFYQGRIGPHINRETVDDLDSVDSYHTSQCVSYGIRLARDKFVCYTYKELLASFKTTCEFQDPNSSELFGLTSCRKLLIISKNKNKYDTKSDITIKSELYETIASIIKSIDTLGRITTEFISKSKLRIEHCSDMLNALLILSMNMRGWVGKGNFPVGDTITVNESLRDIRTNVSIRMLFDICAKYDEYGQLFLSLPLVRYKSDMYIKSSDPTEGITIIDRIKIVMKGDTIDSVKSCIRMSSNWLASSYHYYTGLLGQQPVFRIEELSNIS